MNKTTGRYFLINFVILIAFISLFAGKCNRGYRKIAEEKEQKAAQAAKTKGLLKNIIGIKYTEVRRRFNTGLSFSPVGYQLIPEWRISFPSMDSVNIFSPKKNHFLNAPVVFDHDSVFNVAWAWLKLKYMNRDSLQFQVLHVHDNLIQDEKTQVFMTFYSNKYIKDVLHTDTNQLRRPSRRDTLYIKARTAEAENDPEKFFGGTEPPALTSKSPLLTVNKEAVHPGEVDGGNIFDAYLSPTFNISISKAYDDFSYTYTAYVDERGKLAFRASGQVMMPEFKKSTIAAMTGITDGYLKLYLTVTPGRTLGISHPCIVFLNVTGTKN